MSPFSRLPCSTLLLLNVNLSIESLEVLSVSTQVIASPQCPEVLPLSTQVIASPQRPLLQYHRRVQTPIVTYTTNPQASSPAPIAPTATPPTPELPFAIRKGTCSSRNPNSQYAFTINYDRLSPSYFSFVSSFP